MTEQLGYQTSLALELARTPVASYVEIDYEAMCDDCRELLRPRSVAWHLSGRLLCRPCANTDEWAEGGL